MTVGRQNRSAQQPAIHRLPEGAKRPGEPIIEAFKAGTHPQRLTQQQERQPPITGADGDDRRQQRPRRQDAKHQPLIERNLFARQVGGQDGNIFAFPDRNAIFQQLDLVPAIEKEQRVIELIIGKDIFQIVLVGDIEKLLQRPQPRHPTKLGPFQPLHWRRGHLRQPPRRVIVAINLRRCGLRREPGHLIAKTQRHIAPAPMFILL